jgi:hypothetical protein
LSPSRAEHSTRRHKAPHRHFNDLGFEQESP